MPESYVEGFPREGNRWQPEAITLTHRECTRIEQATQQLLIRARGLPLDATEQVGFAQKLAGMIEDSCPRLAQFLARMQFEHTHEALVVHGLPVREELAVPVQLACSSFIGPVFNYAEQNKGELAMRIEPKVGSAHNTNTTIGEFALHSDDAAMFETLRAFWLSLYGIRNPRGTLTGYVPIRVVLDNMPLPLWSILFSRRFKVRMPLSFGLGADFWVEPVALLGRDDYNRVTVAWPSYATEPLDPADTEAIEALSVLKELAEQAVNYVALSAGTMLLFSNLHGLHKRTAITGDGSRLIFRNYIRPNLTVLRTAAGHDGHVFALRDVLGLENMS